VLKLYQTGRYNKDIIPEPELAKSADFIVDENGVVWGRGDPRLFALRMQVARDVLCKATQRFIKDAESIMRKTIKKEDVHD